MRLKTFYAKTMTDAMKMVKDTLGDDAIIVATREEQGGKAVRVTAAVEQADHYDAPAPTQTKPREQAIDQGKYDMIDKYEQNFESGGGYEKTVTDEWGFDSHEADEEAVIEKLTDVMLRHAVPEDITDQIISCATIIGADNPAVALNAALEHLYTFKPIPNDSMNKAIMLVGPPGAGKTLATAKLAARGVMGSKRVAVISTDTIRAGGIEQLASFTKLMRVNLQKASTPGELSQALQDAKGHDQIFIDTGGMNPFDPQEMHDLARLCAAGAIEPVLVIPAGIDADEAGEIARVYSTLGIRSMLSTRIDIARRLGSLLSAAHCGGLFFADFSATPKVADGLKGLSPEGLSNLLMPELKQKDQNASRPQTTHRTKVSAQ